MCDGTGRTTGENDLQLRIAICNNNRLRDWEWRNGAMARRGGAGRGGGGGQRRKTIGCWSGSESDDGMAGRVTARRVAVYVVCVSVRACVVCACGGAYVVGRGFLVRHWRGEQESGQQREGQERERGRGRGRGRASEANRGGRARELTV